MAQLHERRHLLAKGLVAADSLATVQVAVDARIGLVQKIRLVRAGSVGGRAGGITASEDSVSVRSVGTSGACGAGDMGTGSVSVGPRDVSAGGVGVRAGHVGTGGVTSRGARRERRGVGVVCGSGSSKSTSVRRAMAGGRTVVRTSGSIALRVSAHVLAVVAIRIDTRIDLVHHVGVVRTVGVARRATSTVCAAGSVCTSGVGASGTMVTSQASARGVSVVRSTGGTKNTRAMAGGCTVRTSSSVALGVGSHVLAVIAV